MKERIKELAEQVGAVFDVPALGRSDGVLFTESELERFVELIVKECIATLDWHDCHEAMLYLEWMAKNKLGVDV
jgi:hypothetical protein